MGKYGRVIDEAKGSQSQKASEPECQHSGIPENQNARRDVNLSVKVPEHLRRHWAAEAKRRGVTLTAVIVEALEARFGRPEA